MTSRASDARVCSPPDSADGGLAHSSRREPEPAQRRVDPLVERVAAEDLELVLELGVARLGDPAVALERGQPLGHQVEVGRAGPDRRAQVGRGHERRVEMRLLGEQPEGQAALAVDLAAVRLVAPGGEPQERGLAGAVRARPGRSGRRARSTRRSSRGSRTCPTSRVTPVSRRMLIGSVARAAIDARAAARRVAAARWVRSVRACRLRTARPRPA